MAISQMQPSMSGHMNGAHLQGGQSWQPGAGVRSRDMFGYVARGIFSCSMMAN